MSIESGWYNDSQTIVLVTIQSDWAIEEILQDMDKNRAAFLSTDPRVDFIVDMRHAVGLPDRLLSAGTQIEDRTRSYRGLVVVVGGTRLFRVMTTLLIRMGLKLELVFVETLPEAEMVIHKRRQGGTVT